MAEKMPQLEDEQPVLSGVNVASAGTGFDEFARTLGSIAQASATKAEDLQKEQSNAMMVKSASQMETAKVNSQIDLIKHPDQSAKIAESTGGIFENIANDSRVNSQDRLKLQSLATDNFNEIRLSAAKAGYEQGQKSIAISFWDNYPNMMKGVQDALTANDLNKAKSLEDALHKAAMNAAQLGAITPEQFGKIIKTNSDLYDRAQDFFNLSQNKDATAAQYHTVMASPFGGGTFDNVGYPVNGNTQALASSYNFDRTMSGQYSSLYEDKPLNFGVISQAKDHEYQDFKAQWMGVNQVKGAINSGMPFSQIDTRIKTLSAQPKLSPMEEGEVNYWKSFTNRLKSGSGYLQMMSGTSLGGQYVQEYNQTDVALRNSSQDETTKFNSMRDNFNNYVGNMVSLGQSQHVDANYIQPIPGQMVSDVQTAFVKDAPVDLALSRISYLKPEYRAYLANTMGKSNEAAAVYIAGSTLEKADTTFAADLLLANQDRDYSSILKTGKDETRDSDIWTDISNNSQMKSLYGYLGKLPGGIEAQNGFRSAAINYVLYRAAKEGDVNINGKNKYINDFVQNTSKGFNIVNGDRYVFNSESLNLRKVDMDYLANYALSEAYKKIHVGRTEGEFQTYVDINPLHAVNTPDNRIVVIDKNGLAAVDVSGKEAFDMPYTSDMVAYSKKHAEENDKYLSQYYGYDSPTDVEHQLKAMSLGAKTLLNATIKSKGL